ncbi:hypothetical protein C0V75_09890 [Tabrizicola sp. TH137]|uniref:hypothetical protein n=1 Tax=Tabrizicola sp. TH137 TaxID=2067452 RepID=UPI000C7E40A3|nr:hypothetical protein [Tabrizicola sp. TH137]PLL13657.1 hypothetical protein C0V75_09890 [Tabrizicola sp. TH137]
MTGPELIEKMGLDDLDSAGRERSDPEWLDRWDRDWVKVREWCVNHHLMHDDVEPLRRVHDLLRRHVPFEWVENGAERQLAVVHPDRAPGYLRGAAVLLHDDEFVAIIEGEPPSESEQWHVLKAEVTKELAEFLRSAEVTEGDPRLSLHAHASTAADYLKQMELSAHLYANQLDNEEDRDWLLECLDEFAYAAFLAGYHARAAQVKLLEPHIIRGMKVVRAAQASGQQLKTKRTPTTTAVLKEIEKLRNEGKNISAATRLAYQRGYGSSADANRRLWYDHRRKKL